MVYNIYDTDDVLANSHVWTYTYTIDIPDFTCLPMGLQRSTVPPNATPPTPPVMQDACG
jgi:hypothetical protein